MTPNSSTVPYVLPADMINRYQSALMCQLCSNNPFVPVAYASTGPTQLLGTCTVVNGSGALVFTNSQAGINGSYCQISGDSSAQSYLIQNGSGANYIIYPAYGGSSAAGQVCSIVPVDTLSTNPVFLTAINSACGELESACLRSGVYQVADLQSLNGVSLEFMKGIICSIAIMKLFRYKAGPNPSEAVVEEYNQAMQSLTDLSDGNKIFSFVQTEQAGLPANYRMQPQDYYNNNMISAPSRMGRFMGIRQEYKYPRGGGGYGGYGGGGCGGGW